MDRKFKLLKEALQKQNELKEKGHWDRDIPNGILPVLWFGDSGNGGPSVATVAANPSHKEYFSESRSDLNSKVDSSEDHQDLELLDEDRLHVPDGPLKDIEGGEEAERILDGYDDYFSHNPYTSWFGTDEGDSYGVEGFLRGFGASLYSGNDLYRAVHIDLIPFVTLQGFGDIARRAEEDLFEDGGPGSGWAPDFLRRLVDFLDPEILIVFGEQNVNYFGEHFGGTFQDLDWESCPDQPACYKIGSLEWSDRPVIGLGTNLGNPIGFNKESLRRYGECVCSEYDGGGFTG